MNDFGVLVEPNGLRFERILPGPVTRVWEHLTSAELLARWFAPCIITPREGGAVSVRFDELESAVVACWSPLRRLSIQWDVGPAETTFELYEHGRDVRLVLTETRASWSPEVLVDVAGGWHAYLNALGACLQGADPMPEKKAMRALAALYRDRPGFERAAATAP
jgi:uncharacterized protein YndB with AHSA1/START domain